MKPRSHGAFTLTELLVTTAIMASLMGLVLAGARPSRGTGGDIRRGAQQLASVLLASQSLSLGSSTGAAVIIDSDGTFGEAVSHARRYPFVEGSVDDGMPPSNPTASQQTVRLSATNDDSASLVHGYRIRFLDRSNGVQGPPSDWFSFACMSPPVAVVKFREENGQTSRTAIWPTQAAGGQLSFQVARYPIPTGIMQVLPKGVAIDLRYSGYGDVSLAEWSSLASRGAIAVGFDAVGSVDALMQNVLPAAGNSRTVQPLSPYEEMYFLVTARNEIVDAAVNTLASDKAVWVVVHPKSGRVTVSENVPQSTTDATGLRAAREKARKGITLGR